MLIFMTDVHGYRPACGHVPGTGRECMTGSHCSIRHSAESPNAVKPAYGRGPHCQFAVFTIPPKCVYLS